MPFRGLALLAAGWLAAAPAALAEQDDALKSRLGRIEQSFRHGDAGALRDSCPSSGKVRVDLRGLTDGPASYAPGQLQVVFERIFAENRTREFSFRRDDLQVSAARTAFARASWTRRGPPGAQEAVEHLTFTLREEGGDWRIQEIRSSR
jgi:hypothetical protein